MQCPFGHGRSQPAATAETTAKAATTEPIAADSRRTPGPAALVAFEHEIDPIAFLGGLLREHGDVVRYTTKFGPCFLFVRPDHVQTILHRENYRRASLVRMMLGDGLLSSDGPRWRSQRRLMQKSFHPGSVSPFAPIMTREIRRTEAAWRDAADAATEVDVTSEMTRLTLRVIVDVLFNDALSDDQALRLCGAVTQTINDLGRISWTVFGAPVRFTPDRNAAFAAGRAVIDETCYGMIARRRAMPADSRPDDLLTLLIEAETDAGPMTDLQLRDELVTMLVGGHETTALALAWTWKLLAEHPEVEARLHRELDEVLGGVAPTYADLPRLPYTTAVFEETMRLYPPVWYMARVATGADVIDGHAIPAGACVLVAPWFTHRLEAHWPDPERFDPERFLDGAAARHRYAYFPFGGGRHQCLGIHLANMEGALILAQLAARFRVRPAAGQNILPNPGITLRQQPLLSATVETRGVEAAIERSQTEAA